MQHSLLYDSQENPHEYDKPVPENGPRLTVQQITCSFLLLQSVSHVYAPNQLYSTDYFIYPNKFLHGSF